MLFSIKNHERGTCCDYLENAHLKSPVVKKRGYLQLHCANSRLFIVQILGSRDELQLIDREI